MITDKIVTVTHVVGLLIDIILSSTKRRRSKYLELGSLSKYCGDVNEEKNKIIEKHNLDSQNKIYQ